eukprot:339048_1
MMEPSLQSEESEHMNSQSQANESQLHSPPSVYPYLNCNQMQSHPIPYHDYQAQAHPYYYLNTYSPQHLSSSLPIQPMYNQSPLQFYPVLLQPDSPSSHYGAHAFVEAHEQLHNDPLTLPEPVHSIAADSSRDSSVNPDDTPFLPLIPTLPQLPDNTFPPVLMTPNNVLMSPYVLNENHDINANRTPPAVPPVLPPIPTIPHIPLTIPTAPVISIRSVTDTNQMQNVKITNLQQTETVAPIPPIKPIKPITPMTAPIKPAQPKAMAKRKRKRKRNKPQITSHNEELQLNKDTKIEQERRRIKNPKTRRKHTAIACIRCWKAKTRCSVKRPCDRCIRIGYDDCVDRPSSTRRRQNVSKKKVKKAKPKKSKKTRKKREKHSDCSGNECASPPPHMVPKLPKLPSLEPEKLWSATTSSLSEIMSRFKNEKA